MEISQISFCNKIGYNITNDREKQVIYEKYIEKYDIMLNSFNKLYYSDKFLTVFKKYPYLLSLESAGNKYYLLLTTINNDHYSIFIDTKTTKTHTYPKMIIVPFRFEESLYTDTIIEGSLIRDKHKQWTFLFEDLLVLKGKKINKNIIEKYTLLHSILDNQYIEDKDIQVCPIHVKRLFTFDEIDTIFSTFIHSLDYNINGLVFHPVQHANKDIIFYFNLSKHTKHNQRSVMNYEKPKKQTHIANRTNTTNTPKTPIQTTSSIKKTNTHTHTNGLATFIIKPSKQTDYIYNLYAMNSEGKIKKYSVARIDTIDKKTFIEKNIQACTKHLFVTCSYSKEFKKWVPQKISTQDKLSRMSDAQKYES